jgi:hypothetical protein
MERAFDRVNPGDEVPPPPEELREWASNTATGTLGGMIYGMIQAARTDPFVNAAGEPMSAIVAKRHRWMRGAHEATMGGLRVGSFVAVFSAIEMGAQVKRGGARDMWNTALAGTVTASELCWSPSARKRRRRAGRRRRREERGTTPARSSRTRGGR